MFKKALEVEVKRLERDNKLLRDIMKDAIELIKTGRISRAQILLEQMDR